MSSIFYSVFEQDGHFGTEHLSTNDGETVSINTVSDDETETSGIGSCLTVTCSYASEQSLARCSRIFRASSKETAEKNQDTRLYSRFGHLFAELIERLKSCKCSTAGRSKSDRSMSKRRRWCAENVASTSRVFRSVDDMQISMDPLAMELVRHGPAYSMGVFPSRHLNLPIMNPAVKVHEFRCRFPSSFLALITNYLGYLIFNPEDTKEIQNALIKEAKASRNVSGEQSYARSISYSSLTARTRRRSSRKSGVDKELEHWYVVVHTLVLYLLENKRYKQRFILRRPGNQSNMNELERKLFPPRLNIWICSKDHTDELVSRPAMVPEILSILRGYDTSVLASVLARVLRPHGVGLIPCYLRSLFLQLVSNTMESEIHQRRAIRLLFQLVPTRLLRMVIRPVFELLAGIANEPTCEVDEYSLAVLFSPILFLDQATTTPASLTNPLPARAVELLVRTALRDLQSHKSLDHTFTVPVLFQKDCMRNLTQHMILDNPQLSCSLKYCVCSRETSKTNRSTQTDWNAEPSGSSTF
ncbi:hypothetical protein CRM22_007323 [Opisthorchis felineus]|uniref:Rho-GAP domain-containing protein n=1 Tax=Opisthorchis felineus TaxID=147828 RepID=A0A4S2LGG7_OPIFE|nr:hypothetical protein CRM22_007323 [Opisthorchis felineus]